MNKPSGSPQMSTVSSLVGLPPGTMTPMAQQLYQTQTPLLQALDWLLASPSIPLVLRKQFFILWENIIFGNYNDKDMKFLLSKFREWAILMCWYIPEQKWGNTLVYNEEGEEPLRLDLNLLLNMLEQLYYINLTRGREGFTVIQMTTIRNINRVEGVALEEQQKKIFRLL